MKRLILALTALPLTGCIPPDHGTMSMRPLGEGGGADVTLWLMENWGLLVLIGLVLILVIAAIFSDDDERLPECDRCSTKHTTPDPSAPCELCRLKIPHVHSTVSHEELVNRWMPDEAAMDRQAQMLKSNPADINTWPDKDRYRLNLVNGSTAEVVVQQNVSFGGNPETRYPAVTDDWSLKVEYTLNGKQVIAKAYQSKAHVVIPPGATGISIQTAPQDGE